MPIIKSAIKRVRQSAKRRSRNLQVKRAIHRDVRAFSDAIASGKAKDVSETLVEAISEIDRAVKKGTLHRNTAARRKSKLQKQANVIIKPVKTKTTAKKAPAKTAATKATPKAVKAAPKTTKPAAKKPKAS